MKDLHAPHPVSLSHICENLGVPEVDEAGRIIGYARSHYCLGHLEYLLALLQRGDMFSKDALVKLCRMRIASRHLIPLICNYPDDRTLVAVSVNLLSLLTKPVDKPFAAHSEYLSNVIAYLPAALSVILCHLKDTLDLIQGKWEIRDDWDFVQSVLLLIRNMLCNEEYCLLHNIAQDDGRLIGLSDNFLKTIFLNDLMDEILLVTQHIDKLSHGNSTILEVRDSTFYKLVKFAMGFKKSKGSSGPLLPFRKEIMQPMLVPSCAAASVAISGFTVLAAKLVDTPASARRGYFDPVTLSRWALAAAPYLYVPFGILGIALSAGAATHDGLFGFTSGLLLAQFLYLIFLGGLIVFIKTNVWGLLIAYCTIMIGLICMGVWGIVCEYPKCLSTFMYRFKGAWKRREFFYVVKKAEAARREGAAERAATAGRRPSGRVASATDYDPELAVQTAGNPGEDTTTEDNLTSEHKVL